MAPRSSLSSGRVFAIAWGMGVALAALAAIMYGMAPFPPGGNISQEIHPVLAFRVLPVIVLGGLDSAIGAVYGGLIIAIASPVMGAIADATGPRKPWIAVFQVTCIVACFALWWAEPGATDDRLLLILVFVVIAAVGAEFSIVFMSSFCPPHGVAP